MLVSKEEMKYYLGLTRRYYYLPVFPVLEDLLNLGMI
jgi:hypothetical protein